MAVPHLQAAAACNGTVPLDKYRLEPVLDNLLKKEGVYMQRSSVNIATLIILFSIMTVLVQFGAYYFLASSYLCFGIAAVICFVFCHIILEQTLNYEVCFSYTLLNIFLCTIIILLSYLGSNDSILAYRPVLFLFIAINWVLPLLYCIIRNLADSSFKYTAFNIFYRNTNIVFIIFYIAVLTIFLFLRNNSFVSYYTDIKTINYIPLLSLATLIEDYISGYITPAALIKYLAMCVVLYIPYGFYAALLFRYHSRILRLFIFLLFPFAVEILQGIFLLGKSDIDDVLLGLLGGFTGAILYHVLNRVYRTITDEDFLYKRPHYSFYGNSPHF